MYCRACVYVCVWKDYGVNCHLLKSCTRAGCDLLTSELDPSLLGGTGVNRHVTSMPLPRPDVHRINITLYFEDTGAWGEGGVITHYGQIFSLSLSVHYPLHCICSPDPEPALSLIHSLLLLLPLTLPPLFWTEVRVRS